MTAPVRGSQPGCGWAGGADRLRSAGFVDRFGPERFHLSTHLALEAIERAAPEPAAATTVG